MLRGCLSAVAPKVGSSDEDAPGQSAAVGASAAAAGEATSFSRARCLRLSQVPAGDPWNPSPGLQSESLIKNKFVCAPGLGGGMAEWRAWRLR